MYFVLLSLQAALGDPQGASGAAEDPAPAYEQHCGVERLQLDPPLAVDQHVRQERGGCQPRGYWQQVVRVRTTL